MLLTGYITGDMYSRQQSGPGGPATPNAPPNLSSTSTNAKPGSDYSNYASYGSYSADGGYGAPPRSYGSDTGSQVGGYTSQPPNAGAKPFTDFKEWPSSWQPFDHLCASNLTPAPLPLDSCAPKNIRFYFSPMKAFYTDSYGRKREPEVESERNWTTDMLGVNLKHLNNNLNNLAICCNSWERVGLINVKKAAGLVSKINYSD